MSYLNPLIRGLLCFGVESVIIVLQKVSDKIQHLKDYRLKNNSYYIDTISFNIGDPKK